MLPLIKCRMALALALALIRPTGTALVCMPPSGNGATGIMPDGAYRLSGLRGSDCSSGSVSQMQHSKPLFNRWLLLI